MTVQVSRDALMALGQIGDDMRDGNAMRPDRIPRSGLMQSW